MHLPRRVRWISGVGAAIGIGCVFAISRAVLGEEAAVPIVASMGAGAVLLFGAPHAPVSQPWPALGGHLVSAAIGVACAKFVGHDWIAAAVAVGLSVAVMHELGCLHPPGGATALVAVAGGPPVWALGFGYVAAPVMLNALTLFAVAWLFNNKLARRPYPPPPPKLDPACPIQLADVERALAAHEQAHGDIEDVNPEMLYEIVDRAWREAERRKRG